MKAVLLKKNFLVLEIAKILAFAHHPEQQKLCLLTGVCSEPCWMCLVYVITGSKTLTAIIIYYIFCRPYTQASVEKVWDGPILARAYDF